MATINLGSIKFKWQGAYNGATAYTVDDVVSYNGSSYICTANSTGNLPTNTSYWDQMSAKGTDGTNGTNGTDLTTTLTTQGDIVYRDGSGLARLAAGTANQVLTTGGAGANPSWSTVSSDYVKIASATASGSATTLNLEYDYTPYDHIIIAWKRFYPSTQDGLAMRVGYGATPSYFTGTNYRTMHNAFYDSPSGNGTGNSGGTYSRVNIHVGWGSTASIDYSGSGQIMFKDVNGTSGAWKSYQHQCTLIESSTNRVSLKGGGFVEDSTVASNAITGIQILTNNNNTFNGIFNVYGVK